MFANFLSYDNSNLRNNCILKFEKYLFLAYKKGNVLKIDKKNLDELNVIECSLRKLSLSNNNYELFDRKKYPYT